MLSREPPTIDIRPFDATEPDALRRLDRLFDILWKPIADARADA